MFALVAFALNLPHFFAVTIAMLAVIALSGATHDIAADGAGMSTLSTEDQARWMGGGARFITLQDCRHGRTGVSGGRSSTLSATKAWMIIMLIIGLIMIVLGCYHFFILPTGGKGS